MMAQAGRGRLFAFCGVDGVGKSTMVSMLAEEARALGRSVLVTRQPTDELREMPLFKRYIYSPEERDAISYRAVLCLVLADRLQHVHEVVVPALAAGNIVITDRYVYTTLATMGARGHRQERWAEELCNSMPAPDATFILDCPIDIVVRRIRARSGFEDSYVERSHLERTAAEFRSLARQFGLHLIETAHEDVSVAFSRVQKVVAPLLEARPGQVSFASGAGADS